MTDPSAKSSLREGQSSCNATSSEQAATGGSTPKAAAPPSAVHLDTGPITLFRLQTVPGDRGLGSRFLTGIQRFLWFTAAFSVFWIAYKTTLPEKIWAALSGAVQNSAAQATVAERPPPSNTLNTVLRQPSASRSAAEATGPSAEIDGRAAAQTPVPPSVMAAAEKPPDHAVEEASHRVSASRDPNPAPPQADLAKKRNRDEIGPSESPAQSSPPRPLRNAVSASAAAAAAASRAASPQALPGFRPKTPQSARFPGFREPPNNLQEP